MSTRRRRNGSLPGAAGAEQPRERLLALGAEPLTDAELVAVCLRTGGAGVGVLDLARSLLVRFGSVRGLLDADVAVLRGVRGLGPAKAAALKACLAMAERYDRVTIAQGDVMQDPTAVRRFLRRRLAARHREVFACLYLDARNRVIEFEELFLGSIDRATVHPRELVRRVLEHNAASIILAHNHPSGVAEPSPQDVELTGRLVRLMLTLDVRVLDHLVIGRGREVSFAERRLL